MKTQFYFPAPVEVVKVTNENLAEVAEWCGGKVASTESRRVPGRQDSYVWVPTPKGNSISWAFPGMYITKRLVVTVKDEMKATYAVFRRDYFSRNYFDTPTEAVNKTWEKQDKQKSIAACPAPKPAKPRETYMSKAELQETTAKGVETPPEEIIEAGSVKLIILPDDSVVDVETGFTMATDLEVPRFRHLHDSNGACEPTCTSRIAEGIHIFNNVRLNNTNIKENHMPENNINGVPVLTEEEAAERAKVKDAGIELTNPEPSLEEAVAIVQEIIPGSEVIEESGEIESFAGLTDGTDEYADFDTSKSRVTED